MTLNGVMALILRYFAEFGSFRGPLRRSDRLAINRVSMSYSASTKQDGRAVLFAPFAVAERLCYKQMQC